MNTQTQAILNYLRDGLGTLVGQFGAKGQGETVATSFKQLSDLKAMTGKEAAITGMDYNASSVTVEQANQYLINCWKKGMLVTVCWHANNPFDGSGAGKPDGQEDTLFFPLDDLLNTSKPTRATWVAMLDTVTAGLQALKDAGVPVLWRPFHEMNGGWFWWTPKPKADGTPDAAPFVALWKQMYTYFAGKGLDNLLWCYSPNVNNNKWNAKAMAFYPGDEFVDLVGLDKYRPRGEAPIKMNAFKEYETLITTGKPFGLFEYGAIPASGNGWDSEAYDWNSLADDIKTLFPKTRWFIAWEGIWQIARAPYVGQKAMMTHPQMVTLDELPSFAATAPSEPPVTEPPASDAPTRAEFDAMQQQIIALQNTVASLTEQVNQVMALQAGLDVRIKSAGRVLVNETDTPI